MSGPVLVTGGSGFVGGAVLARLVTRGREVRALTRSVESAGALSRGGAQPVRGDILDPPSLARAMEGVEVVYHLAGLNGFCLPDPKQLTRMNVEGTRRVVSAAADAGARLVVHTSSAATIGEPAGTIATETTRHRGSFLSAYERSKYEAERVAFATATARGIPLVSVNPSSVQGPGRTRGTARILIDALNGRLNTVIDSRMSLVDVGDCAEGHLLAEEHGAPGERYLLSGVTLTVTEALAALARITGTTPHPRTLPAPVAMAAATGVELVARARRRRPPICREMMRTLLHGHAYDGSRATRELGLAYTAFEESLRRTVDWYVAEGLAPAASAPR
ncbi:MAG TPA: NAD-dependent epimerase/dehydratase family protein [Miltoncostaea sp.]|nr:NAD-dependent epimerase/dehydratase family protein [Miltoncostaea sp.]